MPTKPLERTQKGLQIEHRILSLLSIYLPRRISLLGRDSKSPNKLRSIQNFCSDWFPKFVHIVRQHQILPPYLSLKAFFDFLAIISPLCQTSILLVDRPTYTNFWCSINIHWWKGFLKGVNSTRFFIKVKQPNIILVCLEERTKIQKFNTQYSSIRTNNCWRTSRDEGKIGKKGTSTLLCWVTTRYRENLYYHLGLLEFVNT